MVTVNFYGVNTTINVLPTLYKLLIRLLIKTREEGKKSMIFSHSHNTLEELDNFLWTNAEWLPHATTTDPYPEIQPILLTNQLINHNKANYLFILDLSNFELLDGIEKISIIFNINDLEQVNFVKDKWKSLQTASVDLKYFKQDNLGKFHNAQP